ncbi:hypothetical protein GCM10023333_08460 [Ferrimonas pelagia]|uniref:Uncharacterized protein n=1 Tax=Ferrimonas pelagia TaxID=1177826 RepID=A0ABP9EFJ6_9GAMM
MRRKARMPDRLIANQPGRLTAPSHGATQATTYRDTGHYDPTKRPNLANGLALTEPTWHVRKAKLSNRPG